MEYYDSIAERAKEIGRYTVENNTTLRQTAKKFGISKSTCHKDLTERLPKYDAELAEEVRKILMGNKATCTIKGGQATQKKYEENMNIYVRAQKIGRYFVEHRATVKEISKKFGLSDSTCYLDLTKRLPKYDAKLAEEVKKVLMNNRAMSIIKGSQATKRKYEANRQSKK